MYLFDCNCLTDNLVKNLHRKIDSAWESDFLQRKAYYLQI